MLLAQFDGPQRIDTSFLREHTPGPTDRVGGAERVGWPQNTKAVETTIGPFERIQQVNHPFDVGRQIAGNLGRTQDRHFGTVVPGDLGIEWIVRGHHDSAEDAALAGGCDRSRQHWMTGE